MKGIALFVCCFAFVFLTLAAHADMDPTLSMGDPSCNGSQIPTTPENGPFFLAPVNGGGLFAFCNVSGSIWNSFDVVVPIAPDIDQTTVVCNVLGGAFGACVVSKIGNFVDIFFPSNNGRCNGDACGIPKDQFLLVNLNNPGTQSGTWHGSTLFTLDPNGGQGDAKAFAPVSEPASLLLLGTGIGAVWRFRGRRRRS